MGARERTGRAIPSEAAFLTACCREDALSDEGGLVRLASSVSDWPRVLALGELHGVTALALPAVERLARMHATPENALAGLRLATRGAIEASARARELLATLIPALQGRGVDALVVGGPAVAALAYPDPSRRTFRQVELLCKAADARPAGDAMCALGYTPEDATQSARSIAPGPLRFRHPDGFTPVALRVESAERWQAVRQRAATVDLAAACVKTLSPRDHVARLAVALGSPGFNPLIAFKDLDLLARRYGSSLDWRAIVDEARAGGEGEYVWLAFHYLEAMLGTPYPRAVIDGLKPTLLRRWTRRRAA